MKAASVGSLRGPSSPFSSHGLPSHVSVCPSSPIDKDTSHLERQAAPRTSWDLDLCKSLARQAPALLREARAASELHRPARTKHDTAPALKHET